MHKTNLRSGFFSPVDLLILFIVIVFFAFAADSMLASQGKARYFVIETPGKTYRYPADREITLEVASGNYRYLIEIKDESVRVRKADCPDRLCVRSGAAGNPGERIICLPGKLVISVEGDSSLDAVNR